MTNKADYEPIVVEPGCSFTFREFRLPVFESPWHFHPEIELTYICEGVGRRFVGDSIEPYGPGDLVLVGPNLPHVWFSDAPRTSRAGSRSLVVQFHHDFLGTSFWNVPEWTDVEQMLQRSARGVRFTGKLARKMSKRLADLKKETPARRIVSLLDILTALSVSAEFQLLSSSGYAPQLDPLAGQRINRVYAYVQAHLTDEISLPGGAKAAGMSPSAFSRYFKRIMGKSYTRFVNEMRLGQVCRDLQSTDLSIAEIAFRNGYGSLANFNRQFLKIHGQSPNSYRRAHDATQRGGGNP